MIAQNNQVLETKEDILIDLLPISIQFILYCGNVFFLLRTHGFGLMDLTGTMKTGHLISQMTIMEERTVCIYGESLASLVMAIVPMNFLMSARNNEQNVIQKKQNKNWCMQKMIAFLSTVPFNIVRRTIC
jgi:hypothetical protein